MTSKRPEFRGETTADLALRAVDQVRGLLRRELDLARSEGETRLRALATSIALGAGAVVLAVTGLDALTGALVGFLVLQGLDPILSAIAVGAGWLALAGVLAMRARAAFRKPTGTASGVSAHLRADFRAARGVRDDAA